MAPALAFARVVKPRWVSSQQGLLMHQVDTLSPRFPLASVKAGRSVNPAGMQCSRPGFHKARGSSTDSAGQFHQNNVT